MIKGKLNMFDVDDIKRISPEYDLHNWDAESLYGILSKHMVRRGFVLYDEEMVKLNDEVYNNFHWLRWSCMVIKCVKRKDEYIINQVQIQYRHIK